MAQCNTGRQYTGAFTCTHVHTYTGDTFGTVRWRTTVHVHQYQGPSPTRQLHSSQHHYTALDPHDLAAVLCDVGMPTGTIGATPLLPRSGASGTTKLCLMHAPFRWRTCTMLCCVCTGDTSESFMYGISGHLLAMLQCK